MQLDPAIMARSGTMWSLVASLLIQFLSVSIVELALIQYNRDVKFTYRL